MIDLTTLNLSAIIDKNGCSAPDYPTIKNRLSDYFKLIYGDDIYIEPDSKDGQLIAIFAKAIHDSNNAAIGVYNSFSPTTAIGAALSSNVKINGIHRHSPSLSQCDVVITGQVGTVITNGSVRDKSGNVWHLPSSVTIDTSGQVVVTAICSVEGAIVANSNTIKEIATPTRGWQSVNNISSARVGAPAESDQELRARQKISVSLPAMAIMDGILSSIANLDGVNRIKGYDNDTHKYDENGIPPHTISLVIEGGDPQEIAKTIAFKKCPGAGTYGDVSINVGDKYGIVRAIHFYRPTIIQVYIKVSIKALTGYNTSVGEQLKQAIVDYINNIKIGDPVRYSKIYIPANLACSDAGNVYDIEDIAIGTSPINLSTQNIKTPFNSVVECLIENVLLEVTS